MFLTASEKTECLKLLSTVLLELDTGTELIKGFVGPCLCKCHFSLLPAHARANHMYTNPFEVRHLVAYVLRVGRT